MHTLRGSFTSEPIIQNTGMIAQFNIFKYRTEIQNIIEVQNTFTSDFIITIFKF